MLPFCAETMRVSVKVISYVFVCVCRCIHTCDVHACGSQLLVSDILQELFTLLQRRGLSVVSGTH